jgi:hypothetical protein
MRAFRIAPGDEQARLRHNFFYRDGTPETARTLLADFLAGEVPDLDRELESDDPARQEDAARRLLHRTLFFVRAAARRPELRRVYAELAADATPRQLRRLLGILAQVVDDPAALRGPAERLGLDPASVQPGPDPQLERLARAPIADPNHLDLRWIEFMATGDVGKVVEIVGVLGGADRFRAHVEALLRPPSRLSTSFAELQGRRQRILGGLQPLGLRWAAGSDAILNPDDLDLLVVMDGVDVDPRRLRAALAALPAPLPDAPMLHLRTKAAALWTLAANAGEHAPVLAVCDAAAAKLSGAVRLSLLGLLVEVHARRGEFAPARAAMRRLLESNRVRDDLRARAVALLLEEQLAAADRVGGERVDLSRETAAALARACAGRLAAAPAHHARATFVRRDDPGAGDVVVRSEARAAVAPGRAQFALRAWTCAGGGWLDEWIAVDDQRFQRGPGVWWRLPPTATPPAVDRALAPDAPGALLAARDPDRAAALGDGRFAELVYDECVVDGLAPLGAPPGPARATLRIERATAWLAAARLEADAWTLDLRYLAPTDPIAITAPDASPLPDA